LHCNQESIRASEYPGVIKNALESGALGAHFGGSFAHMIRSRQKHPQNPAAIASRATMT